MTLTMKCRFDFFWVHAQGLSVNEEAFKQQQQHHSVYLHWGPIFKKIIIKWRYMEVFFVQMDQYNKTQWYIEYLHE